MFNREMNPRPEGRFHSGKCENNSAREQALCVKSNDYIGSEAPELPREPEQIFVQAAPPLLCRAAKHCVRNRFEPARIARQSTEQIDTNLISSILQTLRQARNGGFAP